MTRETGGVRVRPQDVEVAVAIGPDAIPSRQDEGTSAVLGSSAAVEEQARNADVGELMLPVDLSHR